MDDQNDIDILIGQRVRVARTAAGLTQVQLAALYGCSYNKIHNIESGITRVTVADVIELGRHLQTSPLYLLQDAIEVSDLAGLFHDLVDERERVAAQASAVQQRLLRLDAKINSVSQAINAPQGITP
jgi:transcriptional regulator with XRE-family HTH domain